MPNSGYFDTKRDIEIEKAGGFWCHTCLVSHPATEQSPDPRYCQGCYEFLLREAEMLSPGKYPKWIPKPQKALKKQYQVSQHGDGIMSTVEGKKIEVDIINPPDAIRTSTKRGPKHRQLPEDLIRQLASEGMGSKVIAARLEARRGIIVSYKTIQRILSGERKQLALPMSAP
jgi:hypothetical protein